MAKELIGLCDCPECGYDKAEISETKAGLAMRFCPCCKAQYFPKKTPSSDLLIAKAKPGTATGRHAKPVQQPQPEQEATPAPQPAPAKAAPPVPKQQPAKRPEIEVF